MLSAARYSGTVPIKQILLQRIDQYCGGFVD
jgi:hypothetical protein